MVINQPNAQNMFEEDTDPLPLFHHLHHFYMDKNNRDIASETESSVKSLPNQTCGS